MNTSNVSRKIMTLVLLIDDANRRLLLGMKKRDFGKGKWNGFGGKITEGESIEDAAKREFFEECGSEVSDLTKIGELDFVYSNSIHETHVYRCDTLSCAPKETDEMLPQWFGFDEIPYDTMWSDDHIWLPHVLAGQKVKATFTFDDKYQMTGHHIEIVETL